MVEVNRRGFSASQIGKIDQRARSEEMAGSENKNKQKEDEEESINGVREIEFGSL